MSLFSIRLPDDVEAGLGREAERAQRPKSEIVRDAIVEYLRHAERQRFLVEIARAARVDSGDAARSAEEALAVDNESLAFGETPAVRDRAGGYSGGKKRRKPRR